MTDSDKYVVIVETKCEEPLVLETLKSHATYDIAIDRMKAWADKDKTVRVAVAKLVYIDGNKDLI